MSENQNMPEKKFIAGSISATIWVNKSEDKEYKTISIQRNYKDKENKWKSTNSLRVNDLPKATLVLNKAFEYLSLKDEVQND
jgi:predicted patatin/cPLA2 family phospholipase